jgi:hypothetical protein
MIDQTLAILHDAYRELNAKKLFWIVLLLSGLVVVGFAAAGVKDDRLTLLGLETPFRMSLTPGEFYRRMFVTVGITSWLTFGATVLAIISTASTFPDFITGGSIDLYLSKPISRLRLFLTKLVAGLLFVTLQVFVFTAASFLVIGLRGKVWEPGIFLAVPLVLCFFSYLYAFLVLFGILTRSTLAAVLLTVLVWFMLSVFHYSEQGLLVFIKAGEREAVMREKRIQWLDGRLAYFDKQPEEERAGSENVITSFREQRDQLVDERGGTTLRNMQFFHKVAYGVMTVLPKTTETVEVMTRRLLADFQREHADLLEDDVDNEPPDVSSPKVRRRNIIRPAVRQVEEATGRRSLTWIIGTSLAFEAGVLAVAAWVFCRRDY